MFGRIYRSIFILVVGQRRFPWSISARIFELCSPLFGKNEALVAAHAPSLPIDFLPLGWQYLTAFPETFDTIFLMGVNYHEAEPLNLFHACLAALKPGGLLICESLVA